ncbi:MAG: hypothetical protein HY234_03745 [Acidobacteria bacterium]|nr:hypothetical protein [Acidobacteriota bacterium]MBI3662150.1 hypothetical protein [Acidobacteriota bacterium]
MNEELENLRSLTLVLLDVAANQMAIQKVLCDAHIGTPEAFQSAYEQAVPRTA